MFILAGFDNIREWMVEEWVIDPEVTVVQLRRAFGASDDEEFCADWPISPEIAHSLSPYFARVLEKPEYSWFLTNMAEAKD